MTRVTIRAAVSANTEIFQVVHDALARDVIPAVTGPNSRRFRRRHLQLGRTYDRSMALAFQQGEGQHREYLRQREGGSAVVR